MDRKLLFKEKVYVMSFFLIFNFIVFYFLQLKHEYNIFVTATCYKQVNFLFAQ